MSKRNDVTYYLLSVEKTDLQVLHRDVAIGQVVADREDDRWVWAFQTEKRIDGNYERGRCETQQEAIANLVMLHIGGMPTVPVDTVDRDRAIAKIDSLRSEIRTLKTANEKLQDENGTLRQCFRAASKWLILKAADFETETPPTPLDDGALPPGAGDNEHEGHVKDFNRNAVPTGDGDDGNERH